MIGPVFISARYIKQSALIDIACYMDGSPAWVLKSEFGEPLARATVCMMDFNREPDAGCIFVKDYSENEGMAQALVEAGLVEPPHEYIDAGLAVAGVAHCRVIERAQ